METIAACPAGNEAPSGTPLLDGTYQFTFSQLFAGQLILQSRAPSGITVDQCNTMILQDERYRRHYEIWQPSEDEELEELAWRAGNVRTLNAGVGSILLKPILDQKQATAESKSRGDQGNETAAAVRSGVEVQHVPADAAAEESSTSLRSNSDATYAATEPNDTSSQCCSGTRHAGVILTPYENDLRQYDLHNGDIMRIIEEQSATMSTDDQEPSQAQGDEDGRSDLVPAVASPAPSGGVQSQTWTRFDDPNAERMQVLNRQHSSNSLPAMG